jgi:predicted nucleotidyltransferase
MIDLLEQHRPQIEALCRRFCVTRLDVFWSAATGKFDSARSDIDLLVRFGQNCPVGPFRQYVDFLIALESLLGRKVDLVEESAVRNSFFMQSVNRSRTLLYAA